MYHLARPNLACYSSSPRIPHNHRCIPIVLQFLKELGIEDVNDGVYYGKWAGSAAPLTSINPATGKEIAKVRQSTAAEYEACLSAMDAARKEWAEVSDVH
jgi:hypothetical protein